MQFEFRDFFKSFDSGYLAFTASAANRCLLVTDAGHDAVHVIDVVRREHAGYVAVPGTIKGPRGVAARGSLVAVSAWRAPVFVEHTIQVFQGSGATWSLLRVLGSGFGSPGRADGQFNVPWGLRFTGDDDASAVVVADLLNCRVSMFRVSDGAFVRHVAKLQYPVDVEEFEDGWLVACSGYASQDIEFVNKGGRETLCSIRQYGAHLASLVAVCGVGLVARESFHGRLRVFATRDAIHMAAMSACRVGWMAAVARGIFASRNLS